MRPCSIFPAPNCEESRLPALLLPFWWFVQMQLLSVSGVNAAVEVVVVVVVAGGVGGGDGGVVGIRVG